MIQDMTIKDQSIVGVNLSGKILQAGRIKNNIIAASHEREIDNYDSEEAIIKEVMDAIDQVFNNDVNGIGIGVPSLVDVAKGIVYNVENIPSWREVHLGGLLSQRYKIPVYVNNDANCFTIGEKYFGVAKEYSNVVGIVASTGLGCGVITNNRLYSGTNCGAGEFGSVPYRDHDYEYYCTIPYFETKFGLKPDVLYNRAKKNDKIALAILEQFGDDFGEAIKTILYIYDPECIVIGGKVRKFFTWIEPQIWKVVKRFRYEKTVEKLQIRISEQPSIALLGAAALYLNDMV